jgi:alcohol dehydrogenase
MLDLLPPQAPSSAARAATMTVREHGRVVPMGGVGMLSGADLTPPYPWIMRNSVTVRGQCMHPSARRTPA